jgi:hypothetical protein
MAVKLIDVALCFVVGVLARSHRRALTDLLAGTTLVRDR